MNRIICLLGLAAGLAFPLVAAEDQAPEPAPVFDPVVLTLPEGAPYPQSRVTSVDLASGTFTFAWLTAEGAPADGGNSIGRFTPAEPAAETGAVPLPDEAALLAGIVATFAP